MDIAHFEIRSDNKCPQLQTGNNGQQNPQGQCNVDLIETHRLIKVCNNILVDFSNRIDCAQHTCENDWKCLVHEVDKLEKEYNSTCQGLLSIEMILNDDTKNDNKELSILIKKFFDLKCIIETIKKVLKERNNNECLSDCKEIIKEFKTIDYYKIKGLADNLKYLRALEEIDKKENWSKGDNSSETQNGQKLCCKLCHKICCIISMLIGMLFVGLPLCDVFKILNDHMLLSWFIIIVGVIIIVLCIRQCLKEMKMRAEFEKKKNEEKLRIISRLTY